MNTSSLIESVAGRFPDAVTASHTYRGDATVVLSPKFLLEVARFLREDPALQMNYLMDATAVDYSTFGKRPAPAFFSSSGVAAGPPSHLPECDPPPPPPHPPPPRVLPPFPPSPPHHPPPLCVPFTTAPPPAV